MRPERVILSREKLRDLRSLDSVKIRRRKGICQVEGERSLAEALRTGSLLYVVVPEDTAPDVRLPPPGPKTEDVPFYTLDRGRFGEITDIRTGTGMLGVARIPAQGDRRELADPRGRSALLYLDGIQEPGNVGALIRTAWALGFSGVLVGQGTADPFSSKAVRSSAGGVFHIPLYGGMGEGDVEQLRKSGYALFAADRGCEDYRSVQYPDRSILALGNEGGGFSSWVLETGRVVGIPMAEGVDSLNVVVAGGIIGAEMMRGSDL